MIPKINDFAALNRLIDFVLAITANPDGVKAAVAQISEEQKRVADAVANLAERERQVNDDFRRIAEADATLKERQAQVERMELAARQSASSVDEQLKEIASVKQRLAADQNDLDRRINEWIKRSRDEAAANHQAAEQLKAQQYAAKAMQDALDAARRDAEQMKAEYEAKLAALKSAIGS